jgi:hypothetical protein
LEGKYKMGDQTTAKIAEVYFDMILDTWEEQVDMLPMVEYTEPDGGRMQVSGNSYWEGVQQHSNIVEGDDLSAVTATGIIEESVEISLGTLKNVWTSQTAKDMRDTQFWTRKGVIDGKTQAQRLNSDIASAIALQGSLFYRSNVTSGFEFLSEGQMQMNERQLSESQRYYMLNDRTSGKYATDLAARQTLQGRPNEVWATGQIGKNICGFDPYTGSFLPSLAGGPDPATTVTADTSFAPEGGTVNELTKTVTNVDYRYAEIPVTNSDDYNIGDKVKFTNGSDDVLALGVGDKTSTDQYMSFSIASKPTSSSVTISPKPIALDDATLSDHEKSYANVDTTIASGAVMTRLNTDTSAKTNVFWDKNAIKVVGGTLPAGMFEDFNAAKVLNKSLSNGLPLYLMYKGDIEDLTFSYRLVAWTGVTVVATQNCGVGISYT